MKRFFLYHSTIYSYSNPIAESSNKILLYPYNDLNQQVVNHKITVSGNPSIYNFIDEYNNRVGFFTYPSPHKSLVISSEAEIIKKKINDKFDKISPKGQWNYYEEIKNTIEYFPFLRKGELSDNKEVRSLIKSIKTKKTTPYNIAKKICEFVHNEFEYKKGVTNVFTTLQEAWKLKSGVCQDFANVMIEICRIAEIPTRCVSGYVYRRKRLRGAGATHAWVEILIPGYGWLGLDPTNNCIVDDYHIRLSVGTGYQDCAPVKGVFKGKEKQVMEVMVEITKNKKPTKDKEIKIPYVEGNKSEDNQINSYRKNLQMIQQQQQ